MKKMNVFIKLLKIIKIRLNSEILRNQRIKLKLNNLKAKHYIIEIKLNILTSKISYYLILIPIKLIKSYY